MLSFSSSKEMLKYTLGLAGVGFAYAQTRLGKTDRIFGQGGELWGLSVAQWLLAALLLVFFLSTLAAILAFMGIIRQENEDASHKARESSTTLSVKEQKNGVVFSVATQPARENSDADEAYDDARKRRTGKVISWSDRHLTLLLVGYVLALVFFIGDAMNPKPVVQKCQSILSEMNGARITYPCGASPEQIHSNGSVLP